MNRWPDYDIVIVGAGIVGLTLACRLIHQGLRIAILDKAASYKASKPDRVSVMTLGSQQILEKCQVWQKLSKNALSSFQRMEVWEPASVPRLFFDAAETGHAHLGTVIKNDDLQSALVSQAKTASDLDWFLSESLTAIQHEDSYLVLSLASGKAMTSLLLVGADGTQSCVRQLAGIQNQERDYQQQALVATVQTALAHEQTARQIFLPTGPLAFLPLANSHYCSIVWSTTLEEGERLKILTDKAFCLELARAFEYRLGKIEQTSKRLSFPLKTQHCEQYVKPGIALIGDAVHTLHPLAGQGANLGIADAACLAKVILEASQRRGAFGTLQALRRYERERRYHHRLMGGGIDFIQQAFATKNSFLANTRHFGIGLIEKRPWIKHYIMQYAMGSER